MKKQPDWINDEQYQYETTMEILDLLVSTGDIRMTNTQPEDVFEVGKSYFVPEPASDKKPDYGNSPKENFLAFVISILTHTEGEIEEKKNGYDLLSFDRPTQSSLTLLWPLADMATHYLEERIASSPSITKKKNALDPLHTPDYMERAIRLMAADEKPFADRLQFELSDNGQNLKVSSDKEFTKEFAKLADDLGATKIPHKDHNDFTLNLRDAKVVREVDEGLLDKLCEISAESANIVYGHCQTKQNSGEELTEQEGLFWSAVRRKMDNMAPSSTMKADSLDPGHKPTNTFPRI